MASRVTRNSFGIVGSRIGKSKNNYNMMNVPTFLEPEPPKLTPEEEAKIATEKYIKNLQSQIHLLEVESLQLKEKVVSIAKEQEERAANMVDQIKELTVDPTMLELRAIYAKNTREFDEDKQVLFVSLLY
jgi:hypothetical protein